MKTPLRARSGLLTPGRFPALGSFGKLTRGVGRMLAAASGLGCAMVDRILACDLRRLFAMIAFAIMAVVCWNGMRSRSYDRFEEFKLHDARIEDLANSPDGKYLASVSADGFIRVWHYKKWSECGISLKAPSGVLRVAFSPDGRTLAAVGTRGDLFFYAMDRHGALIAHKLSTEALRSIAFSPDGQFVAAAGHDRKIWVWNIGEERVEQALTGHTGSISDLVFTADSKRLLSVSIDGRTIVWDVRQAKAEREFPADCGPLKSIALAPDGGSFAVAGPLGLAVRDMASGASRTWLSDQAEMIAVRWLPDGHTLASMDQWGSIHFWDTAGAPRKLARNLSPDKTLQKPLAVSPDGMTFLTTGGHGSDLLRVWQLVPPIPGSNH